MLQCCGRRAVPRGREAGRWPGPNRRPTAHGCSWLQTKTRPKQDMALLRRYGVPTDMALVRGACQLPVLCSLPGCRGLPAGQRWHCTPPAYLPLPGGGISASRPASQAPPALCLAPWLRCAGLQPPPGPGLYQQPLRGHHPRSVGQGTPPPRLPFALLLGSAPPRPAAAPRAAPQPSWAGGASRLSRRPGSHRPSPAAAALPPAPPPPARPRWWRRCSRWGWWTLLSS